MTAFLGFSRDSFTRIAQTARTVLPHAKRRAIPQAGPGAGHGIGTRFIIRIAIIIFNASLDFRDSIAVTKLTA